MDQENLLDSSLAIPLDLDVHLTEGRIIQLSHLLLSSPGNGNTLVVEGKVLVPCPSTSCFFPTGGGVIFSLVL